jgi:hypothetical protein
MKQPRQNHKIPANSAADLRQKLLWSQNKFSNGPNKENGATCEGATVLTAATAETAPTTAIATATTVEVRVGEGCQV